MSSMLLFADLHCSPKTLDICIQVLKGIHKRALKEQCEIGFLGDFFDTVYRRGTIPVDMLNTLLEFFKNEWSVNTWMIPGNHDYIDASETEHALEPFGLCNECIKIINEPTVISSVLWVPWKRDNNTLRKIFKTYSGMYKTIFGHFDVIGAKVNNNTISDRGLKKEDFNVPVISGHYHKPQKMWNIVTYIGSPYQTSMSEAGQCKYWIKYSHNSGLYVRIPIFYGPSRYKVTEDPDTWPHKDLKEGDILYMDSFDPENLSTEAKEYVDRLKRAGVNVILQRFLKETSTANTLLDSEKELTPQEMFKLYAEHFKLKNEPGYDKTLTMIEKMSGSINNLNQIPQTLEFESITFEGFGPFKSQQKINLHARGLTKITGVWEEGSVGSSNGAGKSMATVSAFLWCLTGYSDMRASTSLKKTQSSAACINHHTKHGRVEIIGKLGGAPFKIYRASSLLDRTNFLEVHYNNQRITRSTQNQTQELINNTFFRIPKGKTLPKQSNKRLYAWLMRIMVWEQSGGSKSWLELNDKGTKEELLLLCNMNVWEELAEAVKDRLLFIESNLTTTTTLLTNGLLQLKTHKCALNTCLARKQVWLEDQKIKLSRMRTEMENKLNEIKDLGEQPNLPLIPINENKRKYEEISRNFFNAQKTVQDYHTKVRRLYKCKTEEEIQDSYSFDSQKPNYQGEAPAPQLLDNAIAEAAIRKQQLGLLIKAASQPTSCPTCKQALCVEHIEPERIENAKKNVGDCNTLIRKIKQKINVHERALKEEEKRKNRLETYEKWLSSQTVFLSAGKDYEEMKKKQDEYEFLKAQWTAQRIELQQWESKHAAALEVLNMLKSQLEDSASMTCPMLNEEKNLRELIESLQESNKTYASTVEAHSKEVLELKNMKIWLGHKGIQTYIVERMLHKLSKHTTDWCQKLFDVQSQGSPVFNMELDEVENISKELTFGDNSSAHALSGGQYRRLQIAAFMAWRIQSSIFTGIHCNLTLLDEPASNIDVVGFKQMEQAVKDWCAREKNRTCMFISHDVNSDRGSSIYDTHIEIRAKTGNSIVFDYESNK